jgi:hypothetical protein
MTTLNLNGRTLILDVNQTNFADGGFTSGEPTHWPTPLAPLPFGMKRQIALGLPPTGAYQVGSSPVWFSGYGNEQTCYPNFDGQTEIATVDWLNDSTIDLILQPTPPGLVLPSQLTGRPYVSGAINFYPRGQLYGYFEACIQMPPAGSGLWGCVVLIPNNFQPGTELDICEAPLITPTQYLATVHSSNAAWLAAQGVPAGSNGKSFTVATPNLSQGPHRYGVDWQQAETTFYFDGVQVGQLPTPPDMQVPMFPYLALQAGLPGSWTGAINAGTPLPARMKIIHFKIWQ